MWDVIKQWFKDSETIFWARLQMLVAAIVVVVETIDPMIFANYIPSGYLPIYIFFSGVVTEYLRRRRSNL